jgi:hypothetical protein
MQLRDSDIVDSKRSVALKVPDDARRLLDLVTGLFRGEQQFPGGLFWICDLGSRSDQVCDIGCAIFWSMRGLDTSKVGTEPPQNCSFLFGTQDRSSAEAFLFHAFSFGWGGYFVPGHAQYYLVINPDGVFEAFTESQEWIESFSAFPETLGIRQSGRSISQKRKLRS